MTTPPPAPYGSPVPPLPGPQRGPNSSAPRKPRKLREWPWLIGVIVALFAGVIIGASDQEEQPPPPPPVQAADSEVANLQASLDATQEQLEKVASQRDAAIEDLTAAEAARDSAHEDLTAAESERDAAVARADDAEGALADTEAAAAEEAEAAESAGDQFGDGTWMGEDIEPGVYHSSGDGSFCYWERLSGLSGEFGDIIANGNPDGPAVVEVSGSDAVFSSQGCGSWSRQ